MKKLGYFLVSLVIFLSLSMTTYASPQLNVVKYGGFTELSTEDMEDTIQALVNKMVKDCGVQNPQKTSCYDWSESPVLAYNTLYGCNIICVNLSGFRTTEDADAAGETVEYHLVKTLAHEVRHSYQWEHQNDDSDYGRACKQGYQSYQEYSGDRENYYQQFIESDAEEWAIAYADRYFRKKK